MSPRDKPRRESPKRRTAPRETKRTTQPEEGAEEQVMRSGRKGEPEVRENLTEPTLEAGGEEISQEMIGGEVSEAGAEERRETRVETRRASGRKAASGGKKVTSRKSQYLISNRTVPGFTPMPLDQVEQRLKETPDVEIVDVIAPRALGRVSGAGTQRVIVARMPDNIVQSLAQSAGPQLVIERDHVLTFPAEMVPLCADPGLALIQEEEEEFRLTVTVNGNNAPVAGAQVYAFGTQWPARGVTDDNGQVELTLASESPETIQALFIKPESEYWSQWIANPEFDEEKAEINVNLTALSEAIPNFPKTRFLGWGLRAMKVDQLPPNFRGQGIKIGLIDSGVTAAHESLKRCAKTGINLTSDDREDWKTDPTGHGTFCAGIIAGSDADGSGPRGCAPDAEVVTCKLYPGGRYSDLLQALDYCIEQQVDIINLNLGGPEPSELIEEKLIHARMLGITCIAAAGDSGTPVQGLAASPNVLSVAAIGKIGEFPQNSYDAYTVTPMITPEGYFVARFSSSGPQIGLCAPGVAVISSVPPNKFGVRDGTAFAAAHITGLAALLLAHHPALQATAQVRNPQRVETLLQIIRQSAQPLPVGDFTRTGVGIPDAVRAFVPQAMTPLAAYSAVPSVLQAFGSAAGVSSIPAGGLMRPGPASVPVMSPQAWPLGVPVRPAAVTRFPSGGVPSELFNLLFRAA